MNETYVYEMILFAVLSAISIGILAWRKHLGIVKLKNVGILTGIGIGSSLIVAAILSLLNVIAGDTSFMQEYAASGAGSLTTTEVPMVVMILLSGLASPIVEEAVFRVGFYALFDKFIKKDVPRKELLCIVGSTIFFGFMHTGVVQIIYALIMGLMLSVIYVKSKKNAVCPMIVHVTFNMTSIIASTIVAAIM